MDLTVYNDNIIEFEKHRESETLLRNYPLLELSLAFTTHKFFFVGNDDLIHHI